MDINGVCGVISDITRKINEKKDYLTELDNIIADGDHGINMARGFTAVNDKLPALADKDIGTVLKTVGMTIVSQVAGTAGPLYGTAFMRAGMIVGAKSSIDIITFAECLNAAIEGVMARGKSAEGEKTMLDAMIPAYRAIKQSADGGHSAKEALAAGVKAAWEGVEYTKTIAATKGRASYIGERSIGHQDPGATSFAYILQCVAEAV